MRSALHLPVYALLSLVACSPPGFVAEVKGETTLPASSQGGGNPLDAFPALSGFSNLDFNQNQDFQNQGITKDQVGSARLSSLQLKVSAPPDQDLSFLDTVEFYARAGDREVLMASKQNISALGLKAPYPVLTLEVKNVELQPFVSAPSMSISVRGTGRMPSQEVRLMADVKLQVTVRARD
jgi:hypothetical protein